MPDQRQLLTESKPEISYTHIEAARPTKTGGSLKHSTCAQTVWSKCRTPTFRQLKAGCPPTPQRNTALKSIGSSRVDAAFSAQVSMEPAKSITWTSHLLPLKVLKLKANSRA